MQIRSDGGDLRLRARMGGDLVASVLGLALYLAVAPPSGVVAELAPLRARRPRMTERTQRKRGGRMKRARWLLARRRRLALVAPAVGADEECPRRRHKRAARRTRSRCSSSGCRRRSSPATTRRSRGYYKKAGLDVTIKPGGPDIVPEQVVGERPGAVRRRLARQPAGGARQEHRPRQHRAGLRPKRDDPAHVEGLRHRHDREDEGQEGRDWLGGNEFELFAALTKNGIDPKIGRRDDRAAAVRHEPVPARSRSTRRRR